MTKIQRCTFSEMQGDIQAPFDMSENNNFSYKIKMVNYFHSFGFLKIDSLFTITFPLTMESDSNRGGVKVIAVLE